MYKLEILPIAKKNMDNIIYYISNNLKNKTAARNMVDNFSKSMDNILLFPYGAALYQPKKILKEEYRSIKTKNFLMFYTINEKDKIITIVRVLYKKMDMDKILL